MGVPYSTKTSCKKDGSMFTESEIPTTRVVVCPLGTLYRGTLVMNFINPKKTLFFFFRIGIPPTLRTDVFVVSVEVVSSNG